VLKYFKNLVEDVLFRVTAEPDLLFEGMTS